MTSVILGFLCIFITAAKGYLQTQHPLQYHTPYPIQCPQYHQPYPAAYPNLPQIVPSAYYPGIPLTESPGYLPQSLGTLSTEIESLIPVALKGSELGAEVLVSALLPGIKGFETLKKRFKASEYISDLWSNGYGPHFTGNGLSWSTNHGCY